MVPSRFQPVTDERGARLARFLVREDPLADDAVAVLAALPRGEQDALVRRVLSTSPGELPGALMRLHESLREVPLWFDTARADAGGEVVLRHGLLAGLVLGFKSLVVGYCSPAGNKPLVFSGRLTGADLSRRLAETARFVEAVSHPGGMRFGAAGFEAAVRVRLIHARVRHALRDEPRWSADAWGAPINQYDMAGTVLLFSSVLLEGLRQLGAVVTSEDEDATLHLWRFVGRVMGVEDELLSTSALEAQRLWSLLEVTQALPDVDSRRLTHALILDGAERGMPQPAIDFGYALCRHLVGPRYADALELPRSPWDLAPRMLRPLINRLERAVLRVPGAKAEALVIGSRYWRSVVERTLGPQTVTFPLPAAPLGAR